jgi:MFS family permease
MDLSNGIVGWEAQDDPEMPLNFAKTRKWLLLSLIACITFMSPFASTIFALGVPEMDRDFHNTSTILSSLTISVFVLGFAVGPLFLSPLSEIYGRRPVLAAGNVFFSMWQIGCALAPNINALIAFRFLAGVGGSGCLSIGGGVIVDLFPKEERGLASAMFALGPLVSSLSALETPPDEPFPLMEESVLTGN